MKFSMNYEYPIVIIPLLAALLGVLVGLWTVWPESDAPDDFERTLQAPVETEGEL